MTRLAAIFLGLVAIGLASCGGDDDDDAPTRQEFADRASEICSKAEKALDNVGENATSQEEIVDAVDRVIEESRKAVDDLADLERPEGNAGDTAEEFVNATRNEIEKQGIPALEDLREALENKDQEAVQEAAQRLQQVETDDSNRAARELGADACAED
jgi:septation ring formation regulator EzrA